MIPVTFPPIKGYLKYYAKSEPTKVNEMVKIILKKYDATIVQEGSLRRLVDHRVAFVKLLLNNLVVIQTYSSYPELFSLMKQLNKATPTQIRFNFPSLRLEITDGKLLEWIKNQLLHEIETMNLPSSFGLLRFIARANDDEDVLALLKTKAETKPLNRGYARYLYCQSVVTFLTSNVTLAAHNGRYLSDQMINFLYEVLLIMNIEPNPNFNHSQDTPLASEIDTLRRSLNHHNSNLLKTKGTH
jgi:hypothetical protein